MPFSYVVRRAAELCPELTPEHLQSRIALQSYVNLERRYLYYEVPKAGSTSMKWLLHGLEGRPPIRYPVARFADVRRDMFIHIRGNLAIPSLLDLDDATQEYVLSAPDFMRFTVVRNPYARLESAWREKVYLCAPGYERYAKQIKGQVPSHSDPGSLVSFAEFVDMVAGQDRASCNDHWRLQTVCTLHGALNFTHVGRLEDFDEIVRALLAHVGADALKRPAVNRLPGASPYDRALADRVYALYCADFEAFGYGRDSWVPAPVEASRTVPESVFVNEVLERNVILGLAYTELRRLTRRVRELEQAPSRSGPLSFAEEGANNPGPGEIETALRSEADPFLRAHYTFRLAEGHRRAGDLERALPAYLARTSLGHWDLEVAWSFYRAAQLKQMMGYPTDEVLDAYVRAHAIRPDRAEPLHGASRLCRVQERFAEGYELARRGLAIAPPDQAPFLETWIYDYGLLDELSLCAYYTGRFAASLQACEALLRAGKLPKDARERVAKNADFARAQLRPATGG